MSIDAQHLEAVAAADRPKLIGLCSAILRNPEDAEDATQAGLALAWQHLDQFRGEASLSTWIYRAVQNSALTQLRRRKGRRYKDHVELTTNISTRDPPVDVCLFRAERIRQVCVALGGLTPMYRDLLANELTGQKAPNSRLNRVRRRRAIAAIRRIISNHGEETTQLLSSPLLEMGNHLPAPKVDGPPQGKKAGVAGA